jgi:type I restriction enzyme S subunit
MSWRKVTLGDLVENFSIRAKDVGGGKNLPFYGVSNENGITKSKYAAEGKADDYKIIDKFCFAYNPYRINVGSIALMQDEVRGLISPAYVVFRPKPNSIIPKLLLKFLKSEEGLRQIRMYARGTVRQALRFEDLCKIELYIPVYEDQQNFYKRFAEVEREGRILSSQLVYQLDLLKQLRQAFLREAMQGKIVPQDKNDEPATELLKRIGTERRRLIMKNKIKKKRVLLPIEPEETPFETPKNWVWCRLGEIMTYGPSNGFSPQASKTGRGIKCLTLTATTSGAFKGEYYKLVDIRIDRDSYLWLQPDDILIQRGNSKDFVGIAAIYQGKVNEYIYPDLMIKVRTSSQVNPKFIHKMLISDFSRKYFQSNSFGAQKSMPKINQEVVLNTLIPLPPLSEQHRILAKLEQFMHYCDQLEHSIRQSQTQIDQLLQQVLREALRGRKEFRVNGAVTQGAEP